MLLRDMALHLLFEFNLSLYGWCAMTKVTIDRELLPCPFCGGDQNAAPEHQHNPGCYFDVLASFKVAAANNADLSLAPEVLKAWNRRAAPRQPEGDGLEVVGYATGSELEPLLDESMPEGKYMRIGLDHPGCWKEDSPYPHLVPLCRLSDAQRAIAELGEAALSKAELTQTEVNKNE